MSEDRFDGVRAETYPCPVNPEHRLSLSEVVISGQRFAEIRCKACGIKAMHEDWQGFVGHINLEIGKLNHWIINLQAENTALKKRVEELEKLKREGRE